MPFTRQDVDTLRASIAEAGNAAEVRYADGTAVRYLAPRDALVLLQAMQAEIRAAEAAAPAARPTPRAFVASYGSGW